MLQEGLLGQLVSALRCLPGVGQKSAQRMALHLLQRDRQGAGRLAETILQAVEHIGYCQQCRTLTEDDLCRICADTARDSSLVCIVESPSDVMALDQAAAFRGRYFVLHGRLSPLDGIGPDELGLAALESQLQGGLVQELILATNSTVEGEATAHFLGEMARRYSVRTTRLAYGIPLGGELEYVDSGTLSHAFSGRKEIT